MTLFQWLFIYRRERFSLRSWGVIVVTLALPAIASLFVVLMNEGVKSDTVQWHDCALLLHIPVIVLISLESLFFWRLIDDFCDRKNDATLHPDRIITKLKSKNSALISLVFLATVGFGILWLYSGLTSAVVWISISLALGSVTLFRSVHVHSLSLRLIPLAKYPVCAVFLAEIINLIATPRRAADTLFASMNAPNVHLASNALFVVIACGVALFREHQSDTDFQNEKNANKLIGCLSCLIAALFVSTITVLLING